MEYPALTLIVSPFEEFGLSEADARLARGFVYDLAAELARFPQISVLVAESKADAAKLAKASTGGSLRGLVSGNFRPWGDGLRIHARLEDAGDRRHLWAGRYDGGHLLELHDEITARLVNALAMGMEKSVLARSRHRQPETLQAYECFLCGMDSLQRGTAVSDAEALRFFKRALELDPHHAEAMAGISLAHFNEWSCQTWQKWEEKESAAYEAANRAVEMDPDNASLQIVLGRIEQYRREFDRAAPRLERALLLAPNDAMILIRLALGFAQQGQAERARELGIRALDLHPLVPDWCHAFVATPSFLLGRDEEFLKIAAQVPPNSIVDTPAYRAAACALLGRKTDAARHLEAFRGDFQRRISGGRETNDEELLRWLLHVNPFRNPEHAKRLADGLRRAGLAGLWAKPMAAEPVPWSIANTFRMEGAAWTLAYEHKVVTLPDLRGLHDLSRLLAQPGRGVSCHELAGSRLITEGLESVDQSALRAYRQRLRELDAELADGSESEDPVRLSQLEEERQALLDEVGRVAGIGGRARRGGGSSERARSSVTWRIRHAIRRISALHPDLGRHLQNAVRTGAECGYFPEKPVHWKL